MKSYSCTVAFLQLILKESCGSFDSILLLMYSAPVCVS